MGHSPSPRLSDRRSAVPALYRPADVNSPSKLAGILNPESVTAAMHSLFILAVFSSCVAFVLRPRWGNLAVRSGCWINLTISANSTRDPPPHRRYLHLRHLLGFFCHRSSFTLSISIRKYRPPPPRRRPKPLAGHHARRGPPG